MKRILLLTITTLLIPCFFPTVLIAETPNREAYETLTHNPIDKTMDGYALFGRALDNFTLVDATTNEDLFDLKNDGVLDIDTFGDRKVNIRVNPYGEVPTTMTVTFTLTGPINRVWTEKVLPYALFGDINGDYNGLKLVEGEYLLSASADLGDINVDGSSVNFSVGKDLNEVIGFNLIAAENNHDLSADPKTSSPEYSIKDGRVFDKNNYPFTIASNPADVSIKVTTSSFFTGSVAFSLNGPISYSRTENVEPFTLFGDYDGEFYGRIFPPGRYTLTATPYSDSNKKGNKGVAKTVTFTISDFPDFSVQESLRLINAEYDTVITYLSAYEKTIIDKKYIPTDNINLAAYSSQLIGSAFLALEGPFSFSKTENVEPFALFGDIAGNFYGKSLPVGSYSLTVTPYSGPNLTGESGLYRTFDFEIIDTSVETSSISLSAGGMSEAKVTLSPNPATDIATFEANTTTVNLLEIQIFDFGGREVKHLSSVNGNLAATVDLSDLSKGIYFVHIKTNAELLTKKLIVE